MVKHNWRDIVFFRGEKILKQYSSPLWYRELAWRLIRFTAESRKSNPFSFALRPVVMHKHFKTAVGINLGILVLISTLIKPGQLQAQSEDNWGALITLPEPQVSLTTETRIRQPIPTTEVSQGYKLWHQGVDLRTPIGTPVNPIMGGEVAVTEEGRFGYGNKIIINHQNGYQSLYAHLSKIEVAVGEQVSTDSEIGKSGNTGRSTGPHLHLEIHRNGESINPADFLGIKQN